ncbi:MAG: hypothetical protein AUJ07_05660 [Crenarchaeota archaeon 13_1_40CM_3_53_5]|nr:MAG: hypothetical protein AUJ07_05660 [Crenarchaeota archaeon 13_1_40CM_3_53_5]
MALGLIFKVFRLSDLLIVVAIEGTPLALAVLLLADYRIVRKGEEERIYSQRMIAMIGLPFFVLSGMLVNRICWLGSRPNHRRGQVNYSA